MKAKTAQIISALMLATLLIGAAFQPASMKASIQTTGPKQATTRSGGPMDPQEMEMFLDDFITGQLAEDHIPGATVSVVKDGELFFSKGYGVADLATQRPVMADRTLFGIGSTSKLFTWTAVMQLWEQGKVDLNTDVNAYLKDFQIPATFEQPITLAHLLTHTAGFEETAERLFISDVETMTPLSDYVIRFVPERIYPPGEMVAYSNYGTALAGYIVEEVSGLPFEQYIEENIFTPLEMAHTTFRQPLPPTLAGDMAVGYRYMAGDYQPQTRWIQGFPAGSAWSTADDMAKFMIAHLQDGRLEDRRILQTATAQEMHSRQYAQDPRGSGMAYGFMDIQQNGQHTIGHAGGRMVYFTGFVLLPEYNVGLFVSYNGDRGEDAPVTFTQAFMDHYYSDSPVAVPQPKPGFANRAKRFIGIYRNSRHNESTFEKFVEAPNDISIKLAADDTLETNGSRWLETGDPLAFVKEDGREQLIFQEDSAGNITSFMFQTLPVFVYQKVSWFDSIVFTGIWGGVCLLFFLSTVLVWPLQSLFNLRKRKEAATDAVPFLAWTARWVAWGFSALNLAFTAIFASMVFSGTLVNQGSDAATGLFLIPPLAVLMAIGMVGFTVLAWTRHYWSLGGRVYFTLLALAAVVFIGWLNYFNLISLPL